MLSAITHKPYVSRNIQYNCFHNHHNTHHHPHHTLKTTKNLNARMYDIMHRTPLKEWLAGWWIYPVTNGRGWKIKESPQCWVSKWIALGIHECGGIIVTSDIPTTCWFRWQNKVSSKNACTCVKPPIPQVLLLLRSPTSYFPLSWQKCLEFPPCTFMWHHTDFDSYSV
jgi:hypothetical protein